MGKFRGAKVNHWRDSDNFYQIKETCNITPDYFAVGHLYDCRLKVR